MANPRFIALEGQDGPLKEVELTRDLLLQIIGSTSGGDMPSGAVVQLVGKYPEGYTAVRGATSMPPAIKTNATSDRGFSGYVSYRSTDAPFRIGFPPVVRQGPDILFLTSMQLHILMTGGYTVRASSSAFSMCSAVAVGDNHAVVGTTNAGMKVYRTSTNTWVNNITVPAAQIPFGFAAIPLSGDTVLYISDDGTKVKETDLSTGTSTASVQTPDGSMIYALWRRGNGTILVIHGGAASLSGSIYDPILRTMTKVGATVSLGTYHLSTGLCLIESGDRTLYFSGDGKKICEWTDSIGWVSFGTSATIAVFSKGIQSGKSYRITPTETLGAIASAQTSRIIAFSRMDSESVYQLYESTPSSDQSMVSDPIACQYDAQSAGLGLAGITLGASFFATRTTPGSALLDTLVNIQKFSASAQFGWMRDLQILIAKDGTKNLFCTKTGFTVSEKIGEGSATLNMFNNGNLDPGQNPARCRAVSVKISNDTTVIYSSVFDDAKAAVNNYSAGAMILYDRAFRNSINFYAVKD